MKDKDENETSEEDSEEEYEDVKGGHMKLDI